MGLTDTTASAHQQGTATQMSFWQLASQWFAASLLFGNRRGTVNCTSTRMSVCGVFCVCLYETKFVAAVSSCRCRDHVSQPHGVGGRHQPPHRGLPQGTGLPHAHGSHQRERGSSLWRYQVRVCVCVFLGAGL